MPSIFDKVRLTPNQARTVADRRFADSDVLRKTRKSAHANGAMYLAGIVIECLLKAKLLETSPWLQNKGGRGNNEKEKRLWSLCYRLHELDEILANLPEVFRSLYHQSERLAKNLQVICSQWSIHARYSPRTATMQEANQFVGQVEELKKWLR